MTRGAFADDIDVMASDFGEEVEVDGDVVCKAHVFTGFEEHQTGGQSNIRAPRVVLRSVRAGVIPASVKPRNCRPGEYQLVLIGHDSVRRKYKVISRPGPSADGATEDIEVMQVEACDDA